MRYNIIPSIRKDKIDANGYAPLYLRVCEGSKTVMKISLHKKILAANWLTEARRVSKKEPNATLINSIIEKNLRDVNAKLLEDHLQTGEVDIKQVLTGKEKAKEADFFKFAEEQIKLKNYAPETRRNYTVYLDKIRGFRSALTLAQIDFTFLRAYEAYLRDTLKNSPNTIWGNFKFINTITNDALKAGLITTDVFKTYKRAKYKQTQRTYLNSTELKALEKYAETADDRLKIVAKYFLFSCYTGLRYSDASRFNIETHVVDNERIVIQTQKTGKGTNIYINEVIRPLMLYVSATPLRISQEEYNRRLKEIAAGAHIKKALTSHVARHTFGSYLVDLGVSMEVAQGLLAHGSIASTRVYYHLKSANLDEAMKRFNK